MNAIQWKLRFLFEAMSIASPISAVFHKKIKSKNDDFHRWQKTFNFFSGFFLVCEKLGESWDHFLSFELAFSIDFNFIDFFRSANLLLWSIKLFKPCGSLEKLKAKLSKIQNKTKQKIISYWWIYEKTKGTIFVKESISFLWRD